jgi:hypothetical protein
MRVGIHRNQHCLLFCHAAVVVEQVEPLWMDSEFEAATGRSRFADDARQVRIVAFAFVDQPAARMRKR